MNKFWNCLVPINFSSVHSFVEEINATVAVETDLYSNQINPKNNFLGFVLLIF
jgi:hypothetical protein